MEADYGDFEIVRVISDFRLLDPESLERAYWRRDGKGLAVGWYLVSWPQGISVKRFNEEAMFRGPYRLREEAQVAVQRLTSRPRVRAAIATRNADSTPAVHAQGRAEPASARERDPQAGGC